ncbi:MAG: hypothetical protein F4Z95_05335 [Gammaproteobacteria bacterium]|nr:hypothetical protein [Gammaproteobacteria bacterium]MYC23069.1 hypothetical protein [Caldilineaceae bacterium SB0662_bin_25]
MNEHTKFSRQTLIAACEALERHTQAEFNQMVIRLELENDISPDTGTSVKKKCGQLARIVLRRSATEIDTREGRMSLSEAVVREAVEVLRTESSWAPQENLEQALNRDGYSLLWEPASRWGQGNPPRLVPAMPVEVGGQETEDEVRSLLGKFGFSTSTGHLDQALDAHARSHWASANSQLRTFLESLIEEISRHIGVAGVDTLTPDNLRAALGNKGFLSSKRKEWSADGKNYINGLFKMLHSEGSHAGLSDADHSTFRLHLVLVTARMLLRRLEAGGWQP